MNTESPLIWGKCEHVAGLFTILIRSLKLKKKVMPQYKLTYFGIRGRAEATQMIFRAVG